MIDSLPIAVCDNIPIRRSKIYSHEDFRGYQASKKRYFYGLKFHLMVTQDGQPVECFLTPGSFGDVDALKYYAYALPDGAIIFADKAHNDYESKTSCKKLIICSCSPCARRTQKERYHLISVQSNHRKRVRQLGT